MKKICVSGIILCTLILPAFAGGSLVQMDVRKTGDDSVNLTFQTTDASSQNVIVRKKSDNKYVILVPKISSENYKNPGVGSTVKGLISDIEVRSIDDGADGYTKVTLITTKPLNINASTQKTAPMSAEDKEYKNLIAEAKDKPALRPVTDIKKETSTAPASSTSKQPDVKTEQKPAQKSTATQNKSAKADMSKIVPTPPIKPEEAAKPADLPMQASSEKLPENPKKPFNGAAKALTIIAALITSLALASRFIKSSSASKQAYNLKKFPEQSDRTDDEYDNITDNEDLSWQEKYVTFRDLASGKTDNRYLFIKSPDKESDTIEEKRRSLERLLHPDMPDQTQENYTNKEIPVISEENSISAGLQREFKLKAFANPVVSAKRQRPDKTAPVLPDMSLMFETSRDMKDASLKTDTVTGKKRPGPTDYVVVPVDEFFSILDSEAKDKQARTAQMQKTSNPVVKTLSKVKLPISTNISPVRKKPEIPTHTAKPEVKIAHTNPIAKKDDRLVVKSGYDINENSGFYIVNYGATSAVIGKINEEVFVLKKFDTSVDVQLQVRRDKDNIYIVKAGKFKSLVEVSGDKMGVLVEL